MNRVLIRKKKSSEEEDRTK